MCPLPDKSHDKFGCMDAFINFPGCKACSADPGSLQNPSLRHRHAAQPLPWPKHGFRSRDCPLAAVSGQGSPLVMLLQHPLPRPRKRRRRLPLGCSTRELPQQRCLELCHILAAFDILGEGKEAPLFLLYCFVFPKWDRHPPPLLCPAAELVQPFESQLRTEGFC